MREIKVGQRVRVFAGDGVTPLGLGRYIGESKVKTMMVFTIDKGPVMYSNAKNPEADLPLPPGMAEEQVVRHETETPKLQLDSGEIVYGCATWWSPIEEEA